MGLVIDKIRGPVLHGHPAEIARVANFAVLPAVGKTNVLYLVRDSKKFYEYSEGVYVEISMDADISGKVDKIAGKGLSTEDYSTAEKNKLNGLSALTKAGIEAVLTDKIFTHTHPGWRIKATAFPAAILVNYGNLYNWFAAFDARNIAAAGWGISTGAQWLALQQYLDPDGNFGVNIAGGKVKSAGTEKWYENTGSTNSSGFNAPGAGERSGVDGVFRWLKGVAKFWTSSSFDVLESKTVATLGQSSLSLSVPEDGHGSMAGIPKSGYSVRLVKALTVLTDGQTGTYTGNDGKVYPTICINGVEWLAANLCETLYRTGEAIEEVTDNATWSALSTGARCSYENIVSNAFTDDSETEINSLDVVEFEEGENIKASLTGKKLTISAPLQDFVKGPATAEDQSVCVFDNTTGKLIKLVNVKIDDSGNINILGGEATILGLKVLKLPTGTDGIDAGFSVRTIAGESIVQFGNNLSDYYTGAINQAKSGSMIRLDTRDAAPIPGGHAYSAFQIQVRVAGAAYTAYKVPVQIAGGAPEGALCISSTGVVSVYYGIWTAGQINSTLPTGTAPLVIASQTKVANLNVQFLDGKEAGAVNGIAELDAAGTLKTTQIPAVENLLSYGIAMDSTISNPICARVGNMELHRSLPIQSKMRGCVIDSSTGAVVYYLHSTDWSKKENGAASNRDGTDGQVMIEVPSHWRKITQVGTIQIPRISEVELPGFTYIPKYYIGAYEGAVQRSVSKLCSVINAAADYRGGNNNAAYDAATNTFLGRPATVISRTDFRTYARNRGASANWNQLTYDAYKSVFYLYMIEYANLHSQSAYNVAKDGNGYAQGGLGNGVTDLVSGEWSAFNGYHPFVPCGHSDSLGNFTGEVTYNALDFGGAGVTRSTKVCRYRGLENIFGHIWKWIDGINVETQSAADGGLTKLWVSKNPLDFTDANYINYTYLGNLGRSYDYIKTMLLGEIMPETQGGGAGTTTYFGDHSWLGNIPGAGTDLRGVLFSGTANDGAFGGLATSYTGAAPSSTYANIGGRLCFLGA